MKNRSFKTDSKRLGSGGTEIFKFNPIKYGTTILTMNYKRSWENHELKEVKFEIRIH
ncbi:MAG: protease inhibitor I42 family protein [Candidatus Hermodarchaeota archaeon]